MRSANPLLVALYWIIRIYVIWVFIWAVLTWVPGIAYSPFHNFLGIPVAPLLNLFGFLNFGGIGFGPLIVVLGLNFLARYLGRVIAQQSGTAYDASTSPPSDQPQN